MKKTNNSKEMLNQLKADLTTDLKNEEQILIDEQDNVEHHHQDHYHGHHHFDKFGNHDDVSEDEFKLNTFLKTSRKNLIYRLILTAIFLALAIVASAIDMLTESLAIPIGQVYIQTRFLDTIILLLALPAIGPIFAIFLGVIEPLFHNLMHGMEHGWIQPLMDMLANAIIIFTTWIIYFYLFQNSPYHKHPIKKVDWFKRITPAAILTIIAAFISTLTFILALKLQDLTSNINLLPSHDDISFSDISSAFAAMFFIMFGINLLRYSVAFFLYVLLEGKMRPINHRYR